MRYIKTYESYVENPNFFRFSKTEISSPEIFPIEVKHMPGELKYIQILLDFGFPDLRKCIHFMDEIAFTDTEEQFVYKNFYGSYTYKVNIDSDSKLGWSFMTQVNNWWYKSNPYNYLKRTKEIVRELDESGYGILDFEDSPVEESKVEIKKLIELGLLGKGSLSDLMNSKFWKEENVYLWTEDKVKIEKIQR